MPKCDDCTSERTNVVCLSANEWHNKATIAVHECRKERSDGIAIVTFGQSRLVSPASDVQLKRKIAVSSGGRNTGETGKRGFSNQEFTMLYRRCAVINGLDYTA